MRIEIRIYKRHDADLLAIRNEGYPIITMMKAALNAYAKGQPVKMFVPLEGDTDISKLKGIHSRMDVTDADAIALLKGIDTGHWNEFCKAVMRDALVCIPVSIYMRSPDLLRKEAERQGRINKDLYPNLIICEINRPKREYLEEVLVRAGEKTPRKKRKKDNGFKMTAYEKQEEAGKQEEMPELISQPEPAMKNPEPEETKTETEIQEEVYREETHAAAEPDVVVNAAASAAGEPEFGPGEELTPVSDEAVIEEGEMLDMMKGIF